jgi:hypothetical protein
MGTPLQAAEVSLDGRIFRGAGEKAEVGEASTATVFEYHEDDGVIWSRYEGGVVRLGFLVGTRDGDRLEFRYSQLNVKRRDLQRPVRNDDLDPHGRADPSRRGLVVGIEARVGH